MEAEGGLKSEAFAQLSEAKPAKAKLLASRPKAQAKRSIKSEAFGEAKPAEGLKSEAFGQAKASKAKLLAEAGRG